MEKELDKKVTEAMHRIEDLYHETNGKCYVSFSGGKDSTVVLALIKMCSEIYTIPEEGIKAVFANTGIELGITVDFVKWCKDNWYHNIELIKPEKPFAWVIQNKGKPIKSKVKSEYLERYQNGRITDNLVQQFIDGKTNQGKNATRSKLADKDMHMIHDDFPIKASNKCCKYMKKKPFTRYAKENGMKGTIIGIRLAEGGARELNAFNRIERGNNKLCTSVSGDYIKKYPIIDWTDDDVEQFIKQYDVPLSKAYTEFGMKRTGCMCCPYSLNIDKMLEYLYYHEPNRYKASMFFMKDVYIAQNVILPFDEEYERERDAQWSKVYYTMRQEMLRKYRPDSSLIKDYHQMSIFECDGSK